MKDLPRTVYDCLCLFVSKQLKTFVIMSLICIAVSMCHNNLWPLVTGRIIDQLSNMNISDELDDQAMSIILIVFACWMTVELVQRAKGFVYAMLYSKFEGNVRMGVFDFVMRHPYVYFSRKRFGVISYRIDDFPRSLRVIIDIVMVNFIPLAVSIMIAVGFLYRVHTDLAQKFITWFMIYGSALFFLASRASSRATKQSLMRSRVQGAVSDSINNFFSVQICNGVNIELARARKFQEDEVNLYRKTINYIEKSKLALGFINIIFVYFMFDSSLHLWKEGEVTVGDIAFMFNTILSIMTGIWYASDEINLLLAEIGTIRQSIEILRYDPSAPTDQKIIKPQVEYRGKIQNGSNPLAPVTLPVAKPEPQVKLDNDHPTPLEDEPDVDFSTISCNEAEKPAINISEGNISFERVYFGHEEPGGLFRNLNVTIKGQQKVGLVGFSGSGKSSFANLIVRLYEPDRGRIMIDKQNVVAHSIDSLRRQIVIMQQEPVLFNRTVRENIKYGCPGISDDEMVEAAIKSHCHTFIMRLPEQYDTVIGGANSKMSGGQKQRIIIARAMLRDARIIIMDEATSALDTSTENKIQESISNLIETKTVLVIAHRLSTVLNMDRILLFKNGSIIEDGSHKELVLNNKYYADLWRMQRDGLIADDGSMG